MIAEFCRAARKFPPLFDLSKQGARLLGVTTPLREILHRQTKDKKKVSFLQIGANDGLGNDPIREFICSSRRWEGILVEPIPDNFQMLEKNYRYLRHPGLQFLNCAISDSDGTLTLYRMESGYRKRFPQADRMVSFEKDHIIKHFPELPDVAEHLEEVQIPAMSMEHLLIEKCGGQLDVLVMDVEGYESVLIHKIPFAQCKPRLIIYESVHLKNEEEVDSYLRQQGYEIQKSGLDSIAVLT